MSPGTENLISGDEFSHKCFGVMMKELSKWRKGYLSPCLQNIIFFLENTESMDLSWLASVISYVVE